MFVSMKKLLQFLAGKTGDAHGTLPLMSPTEALILRLLGGSEKYGLQLVADSDGALKRGTVYVVLNRMEEKGFVESRKDPNAPGDGPAKRMYMVTGHGQRVLQAWEALAGSLTREAK